MLPFLIFIQGSLCPRDTPITVADLASAASLDETREWLLPACPFKDGTPGNYGLLISELRCTVSHGVNIGDTLQILVALQHFPHVNHTVDRDNWKQQSGVGSLPSGSAPAPLHIWWNAWHNGMSPPADFAPSDHIRPVLFGVHIGNDFRRGLIAPGGEALRSWYRRHGPVGVRDFGTLELLQRLLIPAYFSGCPTALTRRPAAARLRTRGVIVIDVIPSDLKKFNVPRSLLANATWLSQNVRISLGNEEVACKPTERECMLDVGGQRARRNSTRPLPLRACSGNFLGHVKDGAVRLLQLAEAELIITTRLHVASPAIAMGTRVVFIPGTANA